MKLFEIDWNYNLLLITFLMGLLIMLRKTIDLKALEELYDSLLGLGIIMKVETLKCVSQWSSLKHASAILMIFFRHALSLTILLRCFYDNLSGLEVNELLQLLMENSTLENRYHVIRYYVIVHFFVISSNKLVLIWWF